MTIPFFEMQSGMHYLDLPYKYRFKWKRIIQPNKIKIQSKETPFGINWSSTHSALKDQNIPHREQKLNNLGTIEARHLVSDIHPGHQQVAIFFWSHSEDCQLPGQWESDEAFIWSARRFSSSTGEMESQGDLCEKRFIIYTYACRHK